MSAKGKLVEPKGLNSDAFDHTFGPCRFLLRILGAWPDPFHKSNWTTPRIVFITVTMFGFTIIPQTVKLAHSLKDLNLITEIIVNCDVPITIAAVKLLNMCYHRKVLKDLLQRILKDYSRLQRQEEVKLMWKTARYSRYVTLGIIILNKTSLYTQLVAHMIGPISCARKSNVCVTEDRPLYFIGSFPYSTQVSPNYELTVVGQIVSVFFASYTYSSSDSFYFVLIFHLVGQLSILKLLISELPKTIKDGNQQYEFVKRFHNIHAHHNRLCKFHADIEDSFNMMFFMQLIPCIFVLCTQGYTLIMLTEAEKIPVMQLMYMIYFFILFLFTLFGYCYVAETLRQKSMEVGDAAYNFDWMSLQPAQTRLLMLIIVRSQHPFQLTAGKFAIFSLELYCSILKTSAGYLSMLLAVKNRMVDGK